MNYNNQSVRFVWLLNTSEKLLSNHMILTRACLKKAFRELRVPVCGRFYPNEGGVAGYGNRMRVKYTAKWGLQIAEMIFQTRSRGKRYFTPNLICQIIICHCIPGRYRTSDNKTHLPPTGLDDPVPVSCILPGEVFYVHSLLPVRWFW